MVELLHDAFEPEDRVHGVTNDGRVALGDESHVSAGYDSMMERNGNFEGLFLRHHPAASGSGFQEREGAVQSASRFTTILRHARPIGKDGVANEFVDRSACLMDDVSRIPKPLAERARELIL